METEIATTASSNGSLASLGATTKAFVLAHPLSMAAAGGALLGILAYRSLSKRRAKKKEFAAQMSAAT